MTDDAERSAREAADSGDPEAMFALGVLLEQAGRRIRSYRWLRRAGRPGHPAANNKLGMLFVTKGDRRLAERHFQDAIEGGDINALNNPRPRSCYGRRPTPATSSRSTTSGFCSTRRAALTRPSNACERPLSPATSPP